MVRQKRMPPEDMPQPSDVEREKLADAVRHQLEHIVNNDAGDPGQVVMRRMTSAEFGYTIQDLTGLDLGLETILIDDAVGGEGFTNVGDVQFVQDTTLERYLEAAKLVASHAVIGSGPLQFYEAPGQTGLELSAIHRIQDIYREHGFRIAAGEGGEPFGLDLYPRAFFVAWQFRHRQALGVLDSTLSELAVTEGLNPRFAQHIWTVLNQRDASFPLSEIGRGVAIASATYLAKKTIRTTRTGRLSERSELTARLATSPGAKHGRRRGSCFADKRIDSPYSKRLVPRRHRLERGRQPRIGTPNHFVSNWPKR